MNIIIAVDGHSSCGKSTVAKAIAKTLNLMYIDTGAMYRAVTLFAIQNNVFEENTINTPLLQEKIDEITITFDYNQKEGKNTTILNGIIVEDEIRSMAVADKVSPISSITFVREKLVALQRKMGEASNIIMDGRDIGTVVFPNADVKFFMTASPEIRAQRRYDELKAKGMHVNFDQILENVINRDNQDSSRTESPLVKAEDAIIVDNSTMTKEYQLEWMLNKIKEKCKLK